MSTYQTLSLTVEGAVAHVTLARPDAMNALGPETLQELLAAFESIDQRDDVRVVVLEGEGRAFSVGFDLRAMASLMGAGLPSEAEIKEAALVGERMLDVLGRLKAVTIASVHGYAIGGGFLIMAACDLRVVSEGTMLSIPEVDIGLPLIWGGVPLLVRELGPGLTRDLVLTCRRFGPEELQGCGFIQQLVEPSNRQQKTAELAQRLASKPPVSLALAKQQLQRAAGLVSSAGTDAELFATAILHPDFIPTAMAYVQKIQAKQP